MKLIQALPKDSDKILEILQAASKFLAEQGINQWQNNYPNQIIVENDINDGISYILVNDQDQILSVAVLDTKPDPNYNTIKDGHWLSEQPYATIHRIATNPEHTGKGVAKATFASLIEQAKQLGFKEIRIDTHPNNLIMQHLIKTTGFVYCGIVTISDQSKRFAYQLFI
ncbi:MULTISPECIES: GNAT family N-acetyltransferase [unclassified Enterococcus]|uniref:GNAT family N-acetyltransferase n=1 Tax=unclassified Enterococcus TaxID=2608891 RepID=UPI001551A2F0|nr:MULTISPECIES: GNAT family N-acetyltransferase [unclassified Enterococcus]MBS7577346.1 GNAT family N-acetyltransferase [Enterococcus sp. MMGLQ5-2]MBS7584753.1 GNAT family N-acetyltransferase [Enterococcus sp. MMGLQ5-1]NPD12608.1 GNAT family N-acetyltransferase [Enterococcus sp. MMGLQ5-1]NPD37180.1 GNAT family N-acetyltransferase [Enterococcus sp. MMGLQ5-2]